MLRLRSRTAIVLFHQCIPLTPPKRVDPKSLAKFLALGRTAFSCAEVEHKLRDGGLTTRYIRSLGLADDVRFTANGQGFIDRFDRIINVPETSMPFHSGQTKICPAFTDVAPRVLAVPVAIGGRLQTGSAARDGVVVSPQFPLEVEVESGTIADPCFVAQTGLLVTAPGVLRGSDGGTAFWTTKRHGAVPSPGVVRFRIGRRFGHSFGATASSTTTEPRVNGTWTTTSNVKLNFKACPRGGRDVNGC